MLLENKIGQAKLSLMIGRGRIIDGWCQGSYYKDVHGQPCGRDRAVSFCAIGALKYYGTDSDDMAVAMLRRFTGRMTVVHWNDLPGRKKEDVVELYDKAIKACDTPTSTEG